MQPLEYHTILSIPSIHLSRVQLIVLNFKMMRQQTKWHLLALFPAEWFTTTLS